MNFFIKQGCIIAVFATAILMLVIGGAGPAIVRSLMKKGIREGVVLSKENEDKWKSQPGEVGIQVIRNFTIYDFQNPQEVFFDGAKPEFREVGPFPFWEVKDFFEIEYYNDEERVSYNEWLRVYPAEDLGNDGSTEVNIMKVGPLGAWEAIKKSPIFSTALSVISSLFYTLNENILQQLLALGYSGAVLTPQIAAVQGKLATLGFDAAQIGVLLTDSKFGIATSSGLSVWVKSLVGEVNDQNVLQMRAPDSEYEDIANYFQISYDQMQALRSMIFDGFDAVLGLQALYTGQVLPLCAAINQENGLNEECTPEFLSAAQWTIMRTASGQSLTDLDSSIPGNPELRQYYNEVFSVNDQSNPFYVSDLPIFDVNFKIDWAMSVMAYEKAEGEYTVQPNALLNIGNIGVIFREGSIFDASGQNYSDSENLQNLQQQFGFESLEHVFVFWNYMKYIAADMGLNATIGGTAETAGLGSLAKSGVQGGFYGLEVLLLPGMQSVIIKGILGATPPTCNEYFASLGIDAAIYDLICAHVFERNVTNLPFDIPEILQMLIVCKRENIPVYEQVVQIASQPVVDAMCDPSANGSIGNLLVQAETVINTHYACSGFDGKCSNFEFAAKQWYDSEITLNPPAILLAGGLTPVDSVFEWFPDYFPKAVEYQAVSKILGTELDLTLTYEELKDLLSSGKLFSNTQLSNAFIWKNVDALKPQITATFNIPEANFDQFFKYLRYMVIELTFGGLTTRKTIKEAILGYNDDFLENLKKSNPQKGGNPYLGTKIAFGGGDNKKEDRFRSSVSMYTGVGDVKNVRQYHSLYNQEYIGQEYYQFNGYQNELKQKSVWEKEIPIKGTDGGQSFPFQEEGDKIYVHVSSIYFGSEIEQTKSVDHHGLDCFRYEFDETIFQNKETNPENQDQYFDGLNGLLNVTAATGAPMFASQTHFHLADPKLNEDVTVYNKNGDIQKDSKWDNTYLDSEKWTGTTLSVTLNLQNNMQFRPDNLFDVEETKYLPIFYMVRGANFTEEMVNDNFRGLKSALVTYWVLLIVGITLGVIFFITGVIQIVMKKRYEQQEKEVKIQPKEATPLRQVQVNNNGVQQIHTEDQLQVQQQTEENLERLDNKNQMDYKKNPAIQDDENQIQIQEQQAQQNPENQTIKTLTTEQYKL